MPKVRIRVVLGSAYTFFTQSSLTFRIAETSHHDQPRFDHIWIFSESGLQTRLVAYPWRKMALMPFQSLSWFEINGLPDLQSFNRWFTWNQMLLFIIIFTKSFTILVEIPLGNSTFMAKDGQDTSAGRPRCETSNFGIYAVLTLEADMVKTCENNKLVGIKSGIVSPASLFRVNTPYRWHPRQEAANLCKLMQF